VLRRRKFLQGRRIRGADVTDISWLDTSGGEMTDEVWNSHDVRTLGMRLNGEAIDEVNERGERVVGDTLLVIFNAGDAAEPFVLPEAGPSQWWETLIDTADAWIPARRLREGDRYELQSRSMAVLRLKR
jgi:glycogen operon protein